MRNLLTAAMLFWCLASYAQEIEITGTVYDKSDHSPIPGVNVIIKGTNQGTATDINGKYSLKVSNPKATLQFMYIGYLSQEDTIKDRRVIKIKLEVDS